VAFAAIAFVLRPDMGGSRMRTNDIRVRESLETYVSAQRIFRQAERYGTRRPAYANPRDGAGFPDLYRIGGPLKEDRGDEPALIDRAFATATSQETPNHGYWYVDVIAGPDGPYDFSRECAICAVPSKYGRSAVHTYVADNTGAIYVKDNGGRPVTVFPDVEKEGWRPVDY
jgi:hypothetical protein